MAIKTIEYETQQAKDIILALFKEKGTLDYLEILEMLDLDLDLETIVKACDELVSEGRIESIN